jgi:hypothetical protein
LKSGKPVVFGQNCNRTTKKGTQYSSIHAERDAINKLTALLRIPFPEHFQKIRDKSLREKILRKTRKYDVIVFRNNCGKILNSQPCGECVKLLKLYEFNKIIYCIDENKFTQCRTKSLHNLHITRGQKNIKRQNISNINNYYYNNLHH